MTFTIGPIVKGLTQPFLKPEQLIGDYVFSCEKSLSIDDLIKEVGKLKKVVNNEDYLISLEIIEQELSLERFRKPVLTGMASNLNNCHLCEGFLKKLNIFLTRLN